MPSIVLGTIDIAGGKQNKTIILAYLFIFLHRSFFHVTFFLLGTSNWCFSLCTIFVMNRINHFTYYGYRCNRSMCGGESLEAYVMCQQPF